MARAFRRMCPVPALSALLLLVLASLLTGVLSAQPAAAHAELISVAPAQGATLNQVPRSLVLTFGEDIEPTLVRARLVWPGGASAVTARVAAGVVTVPVGSLPQVTARADQTGAYSVVFRVVSKDGHPVSGVASFTVAGAPAGSTQVTATPVHPGAQAPGPTTPAATATPAATTTATTTTTTTTTTTSFGTSGSLLLLGIGVLVAGGTALAVVAWTRRGVGPEQGTDPSPGANPSQGTDPSQRTQP